MTLNTSYRYGFGALFMVVAAAVGNFTHSGLFGFGRSGPCGTIADCPHYIEHNNGTDTNATRYICYHRGGGNGPNGSASDGGHIDSSLGWASSDGVASDAERDVEPLFGPNISNATGVCRMKTDTLDIPTAMLGPLAYAVFITSALAYALISFANKNCDTSIVTAFWPLQVMVAIILSYLFLGHQIITPIQGCGAAMIIVGLGSVIVSTKVKQN